MPIRNKQVKQETRVAKVIKNGRPKATELSIRGRIKDAGNASLVPSLSDSQSRRDSTLGNPAKETLMVGKVTSPILWVPVISKTGKPLMPTRPKRVRELLEKGKAIPKWKVGIFYLQLTEREDGKVQKVAVGIDPGSKREAFTVKSNKHTYLNMLSDAVTWVKDAVETRRQMRRARRNRKTPCRQNRENRARGSLAPSTKARWGAKLRIVNILKKLFPVTDFVVEDIKATTFHGKKWNKSFSPLEVGKQWFYSELRKLGNLELKQGYKTKELRDALGLKKTHSKMEEKFSAHNVDSWVLANFVVGGHVQPDNVSIFRLIPLRFHRRQLHYFQPGEGNLRRPYGGTISQGLKRGSLVKHKKWGLCYLGGCSEKKGISLCGLEEGKRIFQYAKVQDLTVLRFNGWRWYKTVLKGEDAVNVA
jgi:hypothetical protein